ncbi:MAG TPA: hypothetical protein VN757_00640 [Steroidobacteraceae bacterium]|nr:hypothetical protein [Steroidobacteraceae bacterium]
MAQIVVHRGVSGLELERPAVAGGGFVSSPEAQQCIAQIVVHIGLVWIALQGALIACHRIVKPPQTAQRIAQIVVHIGVIGPDLKRAPKTGHRVIKPADLQQCNTQIAVRFGITRQDRCRPLQGRQRILVLQLQRYAQCLPGDSGIWMPDRQFACAAFQFRIPSGTDHGDQPVHLRGRYALRARPPVLRLSLIDLQRARRRRGEFLLSTTALVSFPTAARAWIVSSWPHVQCPELMAWSAHQLCRICGGRAGRAEQ